MKNKLTESLIDALKSVMPIVIIIIGISFIIDIPNKAIMSFSLSAILLIVGIAIFTTGANMSMIKIGEKIGDLLVKKRRKWLILLASLIVGIVITISEPDLIVLANELTSIPNMLLILLVAFGVGIFLLIGVYRILSKLSFKTIVTVSLLLIMSLLYFVPKEFISIAFDSGGVTTGAMGVPLIVAFGYGISKLRGGKDAKSNSFGLCGICSLGPVIIVLILGFFFQVDNYFEKVGFINNNGILDNIVDCFTKSFKEISLALLPILIVFYISQLFDKRMNKYEHFRMVFGIILSLLGLTLFLTGVSSGFLEIGYRIGNTFAINSYKYLLIPVGMILGYIIIKLEPAVKILIKRISDLTEGSISEELISLCLSIGVCVAVGLSVTRIYFGIPIIYIIVPAYFIAATLMYFTPDMFTAIAFDSGGAASGAMTTSFLLPLCIGACVGLNTNIMTDAFGIGALVAVTPIITIQILGIIYNKKLQVKPSVHYNEEIVEYAWES